MARNDFAIERSRKISITISGYDAADAAKIQKIKNARRVERLRNQEQKKQAERAEVERRCRYEQACSEMKDFESLNHALAKADPNSPHIEAFGAGGHSAQSLLQ